jgi:kumamolisin
VAKAYNFPLGQDVSNKTVAILELGGAFNLVDVVAYCARYKYKLPQITAVFVDGAAEQSDPQGADGEVCLDIDVIAAVAEGCKIVVVFAPNSDQGFIDGVAKCIELQPDAISISWGSPEDGWAPETRTALDNLFMDAASKSISVFCASGDNGSSDGETLGQHVDYPASSPYVIACGGTRLVLNDDGTRSTETAWNCTGLDLLGNIVGSSEGGGGGVSVAYNSTPTYQTGLLPNLPSGRRSPDVSGNADPDTGYLVDIDGTIQQIGGTSAVAPLYAALQCLLNSAKGGKLGDMHVRFYGNPGSFYDVVSGSNGAYKAGTGYDCVTGLGVVDAAALSKAI